MSSKLYVDFTMKHLNNVKKLFRIMKSSWILRFKWERILWKYDSYQYGSIFYEFVWVYIDATRILKDLETFEFIVCKYIKYQQ